jgi:hypothetical protein
MSAAMIQRVSREVLVGHGRPGDFRHRAACRSVDPEIFLPAAAVGRLHDARVRVATAICAGCPVREECLTWALSALPEGIAGGMTVEERRTERSRRARARRRATTSTTSKGEGAPAATGAPSQVSHNNALDRTRVMEGHRS